MELGKVGDVFRQHYEKIILGLALLGLAVAVAVLMQSSQSEQNKIQEYLAQVERRSGAPVPPLDLARLEQTMKRAENPPGLELAGAHNLFNPVKWQRGGDGRIIKLVTGTEGTVDEMEILRLAPLQFIVHFERFTGTGYQIVTTNEAAVFPYPKRIPITYSLNETNKPEIGRASCRERV